MENVVFAFIGVFLFIFGIIGSWLVWKYLEYIGFDPAEKYDRLEKRINQIL